jgi:tetratricopeptide (TPR) repeat protein
MNRAVSLEPDNVGVRIPRAAVLIEASRQMPPAQAVPILQRAVEDYEHVLELQSPYFDKLSDHARGELLFGLADGWARLGDQAKAREYFTRLTSSASSSGRVAYAKAWLDGAPLANVGRCVGCH